MPEQNSEMIDLISIVKVDNVLTEQELEVFVQLTPSSASVGSAVNGKLCIIMHT